MNRHTAWSRVRDLEGPWAAFREPGPWLVALVALGAALRAFLVVWTPGTTDVVLWTEHASGVARDGLLAHYRTDALFNHPPAVGRVMGWLWQLAQGTGIPFRIVYRAPIALVDLGSAALLLRVFAGSRYRWLLCGLYCIAPTPVLFSAYHGNTDSIIAFCLLTCTLLAASRRPVACGVALGLSLWVKLPGILAAPALGFAFPRWRDRIVCGATAVSVGLVGYLPALALDAPLVWGRVLAYRGMYIFSTGGVRIWGLENLLARFLGPEAGVWPAWAKLYLLHDSQIALALIVLLAWLRRRDNDALGIARTIAGCYALLYGLVNAWAFQYLAWSIPFWFAAGAAWALAFHAVSAGYIEALYAYLCGDVLLRQPWDFTGHPQWPTSIRALRDLAVLTFLAYGILALVRALADEVRARRSRETGRAAPAGGRSRPP